MKETSSKTCHDNRSAISGRIAAYLTAVGGAGAMLATEAEAAVVGNGTVQPFGINGSVNIDFNADGQTDFQIDHDRLDLNGTDLDYLQIDKNDFNGESNPLAFPPFGTTFSDGASPRNNSNNAAYVIDPNQIGSYPAALTLGTPIGGASSFDFQEGDNFNSTGKWIRANRLIDEDNTQYDQQVGGRSPSGVQEPFNGPNFTGMALGEVRYLGLKMDLNGAGATNYGWIGIRIDDEADATGAVVGYGYESTPGVPITAGNIPEPATIAMAGVGALALVGAAVRRKIAKLRKSV